MEGLKFLIFEFLLVVIKEELIDMVLNIGIILNLFTASSAFWSLIARLDRGATFESRFLGASK